MNDVDVMCFPYSSSEFIPRKQQLTELPLAGW
jgi:hypothetical protein